MCPPDPKGHHLTLLVGSVSNWKSTTAWSASVAVYDARDGRLVATAPMSTRDRPYCMGGKGDHVFMNAPGGDGLHLRRRDTGAVVVPWSTLSASLPSGAAAKPTQVGWDQRTSSATVMLNDGPYAFAPENGSARRFRGNVSLFTLYGGFADGVLQTNAIPFHTSGNPRLRLKGGRKLSFEGFPRAALLIDDVPFGIEMMRPAFLPNPADRTISWPGDTLLAIEPDDQANLHRLHKIALSGKTVWTYTPKGTLPRNWPYAPIPWQALDGGKLVVGFSQEGFVALEPETGAERHRVEVNSPKKAGPS